MTTQTGMGLTAPFGKTFGEPLETRQPVSLLRQGMALLYRWQKRYSERRGLAVLSDHLLRDIGLSRETIRHEAAKPFWLD